MFILKFRSGRCLEIVVLLLVEVGSVWISYVCLSFICEVFECFYMFLLLCMIFVINFSGEGLLIEIVFGRDIVSED